jgi:hypothetical protein
MIYKGILYFPSQVTNNAEIFMTNASLLKKDAFFILLVSLMICCKAFSVSGLKTLQENAGFKPYSISAKHLLTTRQAIMHRDLLVDVLPRGRIRMTKILRASPGSPYIAQYNPLINSKILLT